MGKGGFNSKLGDEPLLLQLLQMRGAFLLWGTVVLIHITIYIQLQNFSPYRYIYIGKGGVMKIG